MAKFKPLMKSKKGFVGPVISTIINIIGGLLIVAGLIIGVTAFRAGQVTNVAGCNRTITTLCSAAYNLTNNIGFMSNNFGSQLPVIGTILAIVIIISAISLLTINQRQQ